MVDAELLIRNWLVEILGSTPVHCDVFPDDPAFPAVKVQLIDDTDLTNPAPWLRRVWFQFDVLADDKAVAQALSATILDELPSLVGARTEGVVTQARGSRRSLPDVTYRPAKPRYVVSVHLSVHP